MKKLIIFLAVVLSLLTVVNALPTACTETHSSTVTYVNPFCAGVPGNRFGTCVLNHVAPCTVVVHDCLTGRECSVHGIRVASGERHTESISHKDGNGVYQIQEQCCPYK